MTNRSQISRTCKVCGKKFNPDKSSIARGQGWYCSYTCSGIAKRGDKNHNYKDKVRRLCQNCRKEFETYPAWVSRGKGKYCSRECAAEAARTARIKTQCTYCGETLEITYSEDRLRENHFCSQECYHSYKSEHNSTHRHVVKVCEICGVSFDASKYDVEKGMGRFCSRRCFGEYKSRTARASYSFARGGRRNDLGGLYVRSSWEANWARYLNWLQRQGAVQSWEYESETFEFQAIKRGNRFYTPDFVVLFTDGHIERHEIKGYMDKDSRVKLNRMERFYPNVEITLIDKAAYLAVENAVAALIPNWEYKNS